MSVTVKLGWKEVYLACDVGVLEQVQNLKEGRKDAHGFDGDGWGVHIDGAIAELATAKYLGRYWAGMGHLNAHEGSGAADVDGNIHVRSTQYARAPNLRLHPGDPDDGRFVLAVVKTPLVELVGWLEPLVGKTERYWGDKWKNGRPAFWVPGAELEPIETLDAA